MSFKVCIDASLALRWILPTEQEPSADPLLQDWDQSGTEIISTPLFGIEVTSAIRRLVHLRKLLPEQGEDAYRLYRDLGVTIVNPPELTAKAWSLAVEYNHLRTSDLQYLAAAEIEDCELWTADRKLVDLAKGRANRVKWLGDYGRRAMAPPQSAKQNDAPKQDNTPKLDDPGLWRRF